MENKSCSTCKYALFDEETNTLNCTNINSSEWVVYGTMSCEKYEEEEHGKLL